MLRPDLPAAARLDTVCVCVCVTRPIALRRAQASKILYSFDRPPPCRFLDQQKPNANPSQNEYEAASQTAVLHNENQSGSVAPSH